MKDLKKCHIFHEHGVFETKLTFRHGGILVVSFELVDMEFPDWQLF